MFVSYLSDSQFLNDLLIQLTRTGIWILLVRIYTVCLSENDRIQCTEYPAGSVAVINVFVPNTISGAIICPQSTSEPESNQETSQPDADDQSEDACKGSAEVNTDLVSVY